MAQCQLCGQEMDPDVIYQGQEEYGPVCTDCLADRAAWDEDEQDMGRIAREWAEYDREPDGS